MNKVDIIIEEVFGLYDQFGAADYIGEPVSQLEHMSQAAQLAMEARCDREVILAAFFHDIGHICVMKNPGNDLSGFGVVAHEKIGADFLRSRGFPERMARLVESHVATKRYLCYREPAYYDKLSEASKKTLELQGGPMTGEEAIEFEKDPLAHEMIQMRRWDDLAKETNQPILDLAPLKEMARAVLIST